MSRHRTSEGSLPTPPSSENSRSRRSEASSSGESALGTFGISSVKFRVGAPPLRPLPLETTFDHQAFEINKEFEMFMVTEANRILEKHGIDPKDIETDVDIDFVVRCVPGMPCTSQPTLMIRAAWREDSGDTWPKVVRELKQSIDNHIRASNFSPSPENTWPPIIRQIEAYLHELYLDLGLSHTIAVHIEHNIVEEYAFELHEQIEPADYLVIDKNYKTTVDLGDDIGAATYLTRNDGKVCNPVLGTVGCYLDILPRNSATWERVALTNYHVVRPCFEGFEIETALPSQRHREGDCEVPSGAEAGHHAVLSSIAIPDDDSQLCFTDWHGFGPEMSPQPLHVESPSRPKHNATVRALRNAMESALPLPSELVGLITQHGAADTDLREAELKSKLEFFDAGKQVFGSLLYGSGFDRRSLRNQRLDWALIRASKERQGTNELPSLASWNQAYKTLSHHPQQVGCSTNLRPQGQASLWKMEVKDKAFKVGAHTKQTAGYYSTYKLKCKIKHDRYMQTTPSSEFVFVGCTSAAGSTFADCGDSGAVVFNAFGQLIGLVFTGQRPQGTEQGYALVTPIEDVFEDIRAMSKGEIVDVRVAE